jgi:hypothetical protein
MKKEKVVKYSELRSLTWEIGMNDLLEVSPWQQYRM